MSHLCWSCIGDVMPWADVPTNHTDTGHTRDALPGVRLDTKAPKKLGAPRHAIDAIDSCVCAHTSNIARVHRVRSILLSLGRLLHAVQAAH